MATEVAQALIKYGFEVLFFDRIEASTDAPNIASIRVMEKAGMKFDRRELRSARDTLYYATTRATQSVVTVIEARHSV